MRTTRRLFESIISRRVGHSAPSGCTYALSARPAFSSTAAVSAGVTVSWMNRTTTSRGCASIQVLSRSMTGAIGSAPISHTVWQKYGSVGPDGFERRTRSMVRWIEATTSVP